MKNQIHPLLSDLIAYSPEYGEQITTDLITPLKNKHGYDLEAYSHTFNDDTTTGVHIFTFERDWESSKDLNMKQLQTMLNLLHDDQQPELLYQIFMGTIWVFIPYCG